MDVSLFLLVFGLGLKTTFQELNYLYRHPRLLIRTILSMNVIMLAFAVLVSLSFNLHPAVKIALIALALSPVPPHLPHRQEKAGGSENYALGLLSATSLFAIVFIPLVLLVLGRFLNLDLHMRASEVAAIVLRDAALPLFLGLAFSHFAPELAKDAARPISFLATALLIAAALPIIVVMLKPIWALAGNGTLAFIALFSILGLAVGHMLGGPADDNRTVLALATATRHPAIALAIATSNFPLQKSVPAVIVCYLISGLLFSTLYMKWRKHMQAGAQPIASHSV